MASRTPNKNRHTASPLIGFIGWLALCFAAAVIGGVASMNAGDFYTQLIRPHWAPPAWLFAPVWTMLYAMMAVAAWIVWQEKGWQKGRTALSLFSIQLAANALWTWLFFAWHVGAVAFAEIVLLWLFIAATTVVFWRINKLAGTLMLPYLAWVGFASALNFAMWQGNPTIL